MSDDDDSPTDSNAPDPAPQNAFDHHVHRRLGSLEASRRFWRWVVGLGAPALAGGAFLVAIWCIDKVQANAALAGRTEATLDALKHSLDVLDLDVREVRARLLKLSGEPQPSVGIVAVGAP